MNKIIFSFIIAVSILGCKEKKHTEHFHNEEVSKMSIEGSFVSDESIYNLSSKWVNQKKDSIKLIDYKGKVLVIAMVYTSCTYACPRIVADIQNISSKINEKNNENICFILVSIDPNVDTPEHLLEFAKENKIEHWSLLNGQQEDIIELALVLGVNFKKTTETDYAHSNIISVIDQNGIIQYQQKGLGVDPAETVKHIQKLIGE